MTLPKTQKNLEETIKEKILPVVGSTLEKALGISIPKIGSDITDKLSTPLLEIYIPPDRTFAQAKKEFLAQFVRRELRTHSGNISSLARFTGVNRRTIHRAIREFELDTKELRQNIQTLEGEKQTAIDHTIRLTLDSYKEILAPKRMEDMYREVPNLSRSIAHLLPHQPLTWKEAEYEFEKSFLQRALKYHQGNIAQTAKDLKIRAETLHRKVKKLGIGKI
ncbi:hypothetical protein HYV86_02330 [Candidatus Woesearchaeota archaeon]|nr:hypothetical protein [Candidatus Woesearchaeota archaeon]